MHANFIEVVHGTCRRADDERPLAAAKCRVFENGSNALAQPFLSISAAISEPGRGGQANASTYSLFMYGSRTAQTLKKNDLLTVCGTAAKKIHTTSHRRRGAPQASSTNGTTNITYFATLFDSSDHA